MRYAMLAFLAVIFPPVGLPLLLLALLVVAINHMSRHGGVADRRRTDVIVSAEPWWTDQHEGSI